MRTDIYVAETGNTLLGVDSLLSLGIVRREDTANTAFTADRQNMQPSVRICHIGIDDMLKKWKTVFQGLGCAKCFTHKPIQRKEVPPVA